MVAPQLRARVGHLGWGVVRKCRFQSVFRLGGPAPAASSYKGMGAVQGGDTLAAGQNDSHGGCIAGASLDFLEPTVTVCVLSGHAYKLGKCERVLVPFLAVTLLLVGCSKSFRDSDPAGFEACTMLDKARDPAVDVDERLDLALFQIGERAALAKTQQIRDQLEPSGAPTELASMPKYSLKDSMAQACRDRGVPVREVTKAP